MPYMATFTINIPPMLVYIPYMDPMGIYKHYIIHQPEWFAHFGEKKIPTIQRPRDLRYKVMAIACYSY